MCLELLHRHGDGWEHLGFERHHECYMPIMASVTDSLHVVDEQEETDVPRLKYRVLPQDCTIVLPDTPWHQIQQQHLKGTSREAKVSAMPSMVAQLSLI
jgi:hypothetical protein